MSPGEDVTLDPASEYELVQAPAGGFAHHGGHHGGGASSSGRDAGHDSVPESARGGAGHGGGGAGNDIRRSNGRVAGFDLAGNDVGGAGNNIRGSGNDVDDEKGAAGNVHATGDARPVATASIWRSPSSDPELEGVRVNWRMPVGGAEGGGADWVEVGVEVEGFEFLSAETSATRSNGYATKPQTLT